MRRRRWGRWKGWGGWKSSPIRPIKSSRPIKPISRKKIFIFVLILMIIFTFASYVYLEENLQGPLMHVAKMHVKDIANRALNKAITDRIADEADPEKLINWIKDHQGRITGVSFDMAEHLKITSDAVKIAQNTMDELTNIPEHIPIGQAFDSAVIASFGPRMPVRFVPFGTVKADLDIKEKDAGINMQIIEIFVRITAEVTIIIPFDTKPETVFTEVPLSYILVVGDVPTYYFDNKGNPVGAIGNSGAPAPSIALPPVNTTPPEGKSTH
jgi:sporulation protein YunB